MAKKGRTVEEHALAGRLDDMASDLNDVKRLLMLLLAKLGADSSEIGMALNVSASTVRNDFSFRRVTPLPLPQADEE